MIKANYSIINNVKTSGRRHVTTDDGSEFQAVISFNKDGKTHKVTLTYTWSVDGDMVDGEMVNCSAWSVETEASSASLEALKETFPEFSIPKGSRSSFEDELADLEYDLEKAGILKL